MPRFNYNNLVNAKSMKKILLGLAIVVVIVGAVIYLYPKIGSINTVAQKSVINTTSSVSTMPIHVFVSVAGLLGNNIEFPVTNTTTGDIISVKDTGTEAQNPSSYIYLNNKKIGEIWGYSSKSSFSPNNKYFAVLQAMDEGCAGGCIGFNIPVINLSTGSMVTLQPQPAPYDEFVESYSWDGDSAINVISYPVLNSYRTSPKQLWRYDLTTGSSTLISTQ